jgi:IS5 family transposase
MSAPTLFDYAMQNQGGKRSMKFLEEMKAYIPYEEIEKILIEEGVYRPKRAGSAGRAGSPPYPCDVLVGALFLQVWYGLSDPMTEEMIHDRLSFRKFLNIKADDD